MNIPNVFGFISGVLGAQGQSTGLGGEVIAAIISTFNNAAAYSTFEGTTMSQSEGRWLGYRHNTTGVGIYMAYSIGCCYFKIDASGNFTIKRLCP